jgi:hypothetical protein
MQELLLLPLLELLPASTELQVSSFLSQKTWKMIISLTTGHTVEWVML